MAIVENDIIQLTLEQVYLSQICNNIFFYRLNDITGSPTYADIATAFALDVLNEINGIQSSGVQNSRIIIKNLTNGIDIYETPNTATGDIGGGSNASFVAWAFRLVRTTALTRHGAKRFVGVAEASAGGNTPDATILAALTAVEEALYGAPGFGTVGNEGAMYPVIVGRTEVGETGVYELDLSKINLVAAAQFIRISSQTTRRAGRGI